jgi:hypothetical protein
MMRLRLLNRIT